MWWLNIIQGWNQWRGFTLLLGPDSHFWSHTRLAAALEHSNNECTSRLVQPVDTVSVASLHWITTINVDWFCPHRSEQQPELAWAIWRRKGTDLVQANVEVPIARWEEPLFNEMATLCIPKGQFIPWPSQSKEPGCRTGKELCLRRSWESSCCVG